MADNTPSSAAPNVPSQGSTSTSGGSSALSTPASSSADTSPSGDLASQAKDALSHVAEKAKSLANNEVATQQKKSVGELTRVTNALRTTSDELGQNFAAPLVDRAADELERVTSFVKDASLGEVLDEVERFARREPLLFLGGAFAVGVLGARFLKSSARRSDVVAGTPGRSPSDSQRREGGQRGTGQGLRDRTP